MIRCATSLILFLTLSPPFCGAEPLTFEVKLDPLFGNYSDLFESPAGLIVVLENSGFTFSHAGRIKILNTREFELRRNKSIPFKTATVAYTGKRGKVYQYRVTVDWSVGVIGKSIDIKTEINTQKIAEGKIALSVNLPLSFLMPDVLKGYVDEKIAGLANANVQQEVLEYLAIADRQVKVFGGSRLEWLLLDAYNLPRNVLEEPLTVGRILVGFLLLWMGILPLALAIALVLNFLLRRPLPSH